MATVNPSIRPWRKHLVQVARAWPQNKQDGWQDLPYVRCTGGSDGLCAQMGEATFEQDAGEIKEPGMTEAGVFQGSRIAGDDITYLAGAFVRVLLADPSGDITAMGKPWRSLWYGVMQAPEFQLDGHPRTTGGLIRWTAFGLLHVLHSIWLCNGSERAYHATPSTTTLVDAGQAIGCNLIAGGDRSSGTATVNGQTVYVPDRSGQASSATMWTAQQWGEWLLAFYASPQALGVPAQAENGMRWYLPDLGLLDFEVEPHEIHGRRLLEELCLLINPARGLAFYASVDETDMSVDLATVVTTTQTVEEGPVTIGPAATTDLDLRDDVWVMDHPQLLFTNDLYDYLLATTRQPPWVSITVWFDPANPTTCPLIPDGWAVGDPPDGRKVWRRWKLNPTWNGLMYDKSDVGLRHQIRTGEAPPDGTRTWQATGNPPVAALELTRELPLDKDRGSSRVGPRGKPVVAMQNGATWEDLSRKIEVTVDERGTIWLGTTLNDGNLMKSRASGTNKLLLTIGVREWAPTQVGWLRPRSAWPNSVPRIGPPAVLAEAEQWVGLAGTVTGVAAGALTTLATQQVVRDDLPLVQAELAKQRARYGKDVSARLTWGVDGQVLPPNQDTYFPGVVVGDVITASRQVTVDAVVTRRQFRLGFADFGCTYFCERLLATSKPKG